MLLFKFVDCFSKLRKENKVLSKLRVYSALRFLLRKLLMLCKPFLHSDIALSKEKGDQRIIVSLTSFPKRFNNLWLVLESMLGQSMQPDKIIVWLCKDEVESIDLLPETLREMQKRGVEFRFCEKNLRSYNKFYYACTEFRDDFIITIDDDIIYPQSLIENLMNLHKRFPDCICCNAGMLITLNDEGDIAKLSEWIISEDEIKSDRMMAQGVGGVLYPPHSLPEYTFNDKAFTEVCPRDDDTWLHVMEKMKGISIVKGQLYFSLLPLTASNDVRICDLLFITDTSDTIRKIRQYVVNDLGIDPYGIWKV